ncbi:C-type lectin domain family 17, member A-like isoform X2 [Diprion similis]|uniref:C-type lectin domain family 17, member A-like isoform X2 n=1 Tax=Diprion similis TaxID=362088 RepID=UPI001EF75D17|nr:C-type lectin domain family 17, member A-like isoform X2 [Diprion similis]
MAPMIAYTLPAMQLVCNLVIPQAPNLTINNVDSGVATGASDNRNVSVVKELPGLDHDVTPTSNPPVTPSLPTIQAKTLPDGYLSFPKFGVAWKAHNETATYPVAAKRCVEEGGNLAVIDSWRKFNVVQQLLSKDDEHYFVGITRMYETKDWVDVRTGSPVSGIPWGPAEPNDNRYCAKMRASYSGLWNWICLEKQRFVCEIQVPQSHD